MAARLAGCLLVVVTAIAANGCGRTALVPDDRVHTASAGGSSGGQSGPFTQKFAALNRDVDVLFMVDDSGSMTTWQGKLVTNFPAFLRVLEGLPGGLPSIHIAIVSSDMGAGPEPTGAIGHCALGGDRGAFQYTPRGTCTSTGLQGGATFISNENGVKNYTGAMEDVFSCIAQLGDQGCGFEHQLASVARALGADGNPPPPENAGFLRPDALLAIVLLTNEDDCSAPPDTQMFDPGSRWVSDPWGPLTSFRCNEFGHLCGGARPPRTMDADLSGTCHSAEDQGALLPIAGIAAQLRALKRNPASVFLGAMAAPPDHYRVTLIPSQQGDPSPTWPSVDHSCVASAGEYGDPAVRIAELVTAFGPNGAFVNICAASFAPALQQVLRAITGPAPHCLAGSPGDPPSCMASLDGTPLPLCPARTGTACLLLRGNPLCPSGSDALIDPNDGAVDLTATVTLHCNG